MSLAIQTFQVVFRSGDGTGNNNSKTFTLNLNRLLSSSFTQWNVRTKFFSRLGQFNGSVSEVRWNLSNTNQYDTRTSSSGNTLVYPRILPEIDNDGLPLGSTLFADFSESSPLFINTPTTTEITISIFDNTSTLMSNMSAWTLHLEFSPVTQKSTRR